MKPNLEQKHKTSIEVIHWSHEEIERQFLDYIERIYSELCNVLDKMPTNMKFYFDDEPVREGYALRGHAHANDIITIAFDPDYDDVEQARKELRELIFHEAFHIRQGFTLISGMFSGIESAVYEGCGSIFERDFAYSTKDAANYQIVPASKLLDWKNQLDEIDAKQFQQVWRDWLFYDNNDGENWKSYLVGTWLVDTLLKKTGKSILDLRDMSANEILYLYKTA